STVYVGLAFSAGVVRNFREVVAAQVSSSLFDRGSKLRGPTQNSTRAASKLDINVPKPKPEWLINVFGDSDAQKVKNRLTELQEDEKPSHLLRRMKELSNGPLNGDFFQNLWLRRMPPHIHLPRV
ncbi:hypothetical protein AVEN_180122-1, partial [Araneus ventricosus]